jgi:transposase
MVFFLGCDVAKTKIDVSLVNEQGIEQWADKVPNEVLSIATALLTFAGAYPSGEIQCVVEATGTWRLKLANTCHSLGIPCRVYNPILTRQQIKMTVRGQEDGSDLCLVNCQNGGAW